MVQNQNTKVYIVGDKILPQLDNDSSSKTIIEQRDVVFEADFPASNTKLKLLKNSKVRFAMFEGAKEPRIEMGTLLGIEKNGQFYVQRYNNTHETVPNILYDTAYIESKSYVNSQTFITEEDGKYYNYIMEHIKNVNKAFRYFANDLSYILDFDMQRLDLRVRTHDASKFSRYEFDGYRQNFFPVNENQTNSEKFRAAWAHHKLFNDHHPENYIPRFGKNPYRMPDIAIAEMFLDWCAMSMKFGNRPDIWFKERGCRELVFAEDTEKKIYNLLRDFDFSRWKEKEEENNGKNVKKVQKEDCKESVGIHELESEKET